MAVYGAQTPSFQAALFPFERLVLYNVDLGTAGDQWSQITLTLPQDIDEALITGIACIGNTPPATARDVDAQNEAFVISVQYPGATYYMPGTYTRGRNINVTSFSQNSPQNVLWTWQGRISYKADAQTIVIFVPPVDDHDAAPTADLGITLQLDNCISKRS